MRGLGWVVMAAALAGPVFAQSLAGVAARDQERRARKGSPPAPAYTDADLRASPSPSPPPSPSPSPISWQGAPAKPVGWKAPTSPTPAPAASGGQTASPSPSPEAPDRSEQERAALEAQWKAIARQRRDALAQAETRLAELEARINALRNDLSPVGLGDPNREQTRQAEIGQAQRELEAARAALATAGQAVDDLEDDVRRAGGLPGWVR